MAVVARLTKRARVVAMVALVTCALPVATAQDLRPLSDLLGPVVLNEVVDGDTVVVRSDLGPRTVRLIGIDSPEMNEGTPWLLAREALVRFASPGTPVWVEMGREVEDRYGRLLAYVYVEDPAGRWLVAGFRATQLNLAMVEAGWADTLTIPPNDDYAAMYAAAKALAASRTFGLWGGGSGGAAVGVGAGAAGAATDGALASAAAPRLHCALVNPDTPNDTGAEWVSVWLDEALDMTGYYLWDEGSRSTFRLPSGVQPGGEIRLVNPGQGVWNNSGDTIYLMHGGDIVDQWSYGRELAVEGRVACR